jgi:hypothetical protein
MSGQLQRKLGAYSSRFDKTNVGFSPEFRRGNGFEDSPATVIRQPCTDLYCVFMLENQLHGVAEAQTL